MNQATFNGRVDSRLISEVQDLLGSETSLLSPLRDMLMRPGFQSLLRTGPGSAQITGRDALIGDLKQTYHPGIVLRLEDVLNGIFNLPATATGDHHPHSEYAYPQQAYSNPGRSSTNTSGHSVHTYALQTTPASQGILTGAAIALLSLLLGGGVMGVGWLLLSQSQASKQIQGNTSSGASAAPRLFTNQPVPKPPDSPSEPGDSNPWGRAEDYKFGQGPNSQYPDTCAFSTTDDRGEQTLVDKSRLEFWACRDVGGNPTDGYTVIWGDGKRTMYHFNPNGMGSVVGTNGQSVAIRWQNGSHHGQPIIVINHQDGATSWIPGNVGN